MNSSRMSNYNHRTTAIIAVDLFNKSLDTVLINEEYPMKLASTTIKDPTLQEIFIRHSTDDLETFRAYCISIVENARAPNRSLLIQMKNMNKNQLVKSVTNFAFKGMGLGVK